MDGNAKVMMSRLARAAGNVCSAVESNAWAIMFAASLLCGMTASAAPSPSDWLLNLSTASNPEYDEANPTAPYWVNTAPQIVVSGQYVHVAWFSNIYSWEPAAKRQLIYRRSTDGGATFDAAVVLLDETYGTDDTSGGIWHTECPQLAVDGAYVHIIYRWKSKDATNPVGLKYRRSIDNGATFEPVVPIVNSVVNYPGVDAYTFIAAQNGKVAIIYTRNLYWVGAYGNVDRYLTGSCLHSADNGTTFASTTLFLYEGAPTPEAPYQSVQAVDLVMSGDYVYAMMNRGELTSIFGSSDGGATFKPSVHVSAISDDGKYYPSIFRGGAAYSPNIAANGADAYVVWQNQFTDAAGANPRWSLLVRRTTDGFATIGAPAVVKEYPVGSTAPYPGLETIAMKDGRLCVAANESNGWAYTWSTGTPGTSWGAGDILTKLCTSLPLICPDPTSGSKVFNAIANWYFRSTDGGITFNGGVNEHLPSGIWATPAMSVGADGVVHAIASYDSYNNGTKTAIYYRRLAPPPAPGAANKSLELVNNSDSTTFNSPRYDNMQAAGSASMAFTTALTAEFWVKCTSDDLLLNFTPIVAKPLDYLNSFEVGINPYTGKIYGRVATETAYPEPIEHSSGLVKDAWTHLAITYDAAAGADNFKLYVNGVESKKATIVGNIKNITPDYPLVLGKTGPAYAAWEMKTSSMRIDELRLWNKALSATEILAGKDKTMTGAEAGLVARYGFDDTTMDSTPNANNGILMFKETYVADHAIADTVTLTMAASPATGGTTTPSVATPVPVGTATAITATAATGYTFVNWTASAAATLAAASSPSTTATLSAAATVTANFTLNTYTLTYTAGVGGTITGTTPQTVNHGASGTSVTAAPNTGYTFVKWSDGLTTAARTDANVTGNISVSAEFAVNKYTLTYTAGVGGTITGTTPQTVNHGASGAAVTAAPNTGYTFVKWSDGLTTAARTDANVTANITVSAEFAVNKYTLTYTAGVGGTITGTTPQTVNHGASGTAVTAAPNTGYTFVKWSDGLTTAARTDANVTANITVTASYQAAPPATYNLSVINGTGSGAYAPGTAVPIMAKAPPEKQLFERWEGDVGILANSYAASTTAVMPARDATVFPLYMSEKTKIYTLTVVSGSGSGRYSEGSSMTIIADPPSAGYLFNGWRGAKVAAPLATSTKMAMPSADTTVTATYRKSDETNYLLDVVGGFGTGRYLAGETVEISADPPYVGEIFKEWSGAEVIDKYVQSTTMTMPAANTTVTALFSDIGWTSVVSFTSTHSESAKNGVTHAKDAYTVTATFTFPKNSLVTPLTILNNSNPTLCDDNWMGISIGEFIFEDQIKDAKSKKITTKLGTATFTTINNDTVIYKWDAKKITVSVKSKLPADAWFNILDINDYPAGVYKYEALYYDPFMIFGDAVWNNSMPWTGTVKIDKKGMRSWTAKGKATN